MFGGTDVGRDSSWTACAHVLLISPAQRAALATFALRARLCRQKAGVSGDDVPPPRAWCRQTRPVRGAACLDRVAEGAAPCAADRLRSALIAVFTSTASAPISMASAAVAGRAEAGVDDDRHGRLLDDDLELRRVVREAAGCDPMGDPSGITVAAPGLLQALARARDRR